MKLIILHDSTLQGIHALESIPALLQDGTLLPADRAWDAKNEALIRLDSPEFVGLSGHHHHDSWARYYDHVYSQLPRFAAYTEESVRLLLTLAPPPSSMLDLGAGTGRLAIPLAEVGNHVTAVDISSGLLAILREKVEQLRLQERVEICQGLIQAFDSPPRHGKIHLIICLHAVLNYLLETADLERFADVAARHARPGGYLVIDLADKGVMVSQAILTPKFRRIQKVHPLGDDQFHISDTSRGYLFGEPFDFQAEDWTARYWQPEFVIRLLEARGFRAAQFLFCKLIEHQTEGGVWFAMLR
ncbi:MAG: hypothetical protein RL514_4409 [Verrucomicrobiota bacterium]|jgi:SAM-dependent methyltransferase